MAETGENPNIVRNSAMKYGVGVGVGGGVAAALVFGLLPALLRQFKVVDLSKRELFLIAGIGLAVIALFFAVWIGKGKMAKLEGEKTTAEQAEQAALEAAEGEKSALQAVMDMPLQEKIQEVVTDCEAKLQAAGVVLNRATEELDTLNSVTDADKDEEAIKAKEKEKEEQEGKVQKMTSPLEKLKGLNDDIKGTTIEALFTVLNDVKAAFPNLTTANTKLVESVSTPLASSLNTPPLNT